MADRLIVEASWLIDAVGEPQENGCVVIQDGRIEDVGPSLTVLAKPEYADSCETLKFEGCTLMPGLINCHGHAAIIWPRRQETTTRLILRAARKLWESLKMGVTTFRDNGAKDAVNIDLRDAIAEGTLCGPRVLACGRPIAKTGGHAYWMAREADGPDEVRKAAREQLKAGADHLKIMATGGIGAVGDSPHFQELGRDEIAAAVEEAHKMGRKTTAHADGAAGAKNAILAGIDCIEHGKFLDDECIALMVERGVYLVPTFSGTDAIAQSGVGLLGRSQHEQDLARACQPGHIATFAKAVKAGVKVATGTDSAGDIVRELELMVKAGLSPLEAIVAATRTASEVIQMADKVGTLEVGKFADAVVVEGNPLEDITAIRNVRLVIKDGKVVCSQHCLDR